MHIVHISRWQISRIESWNFHCQGLDVVQIEFRSCSDMLTVESQLVKVEIRDVEVDQLQETLKARMLKEMLKEMLKWISCRRH